MSDQKARPSPMAAWKSIAIFVTGTLVGAISIVQVVPNSQLSSAQGATEGTTLAPDGSTAVTGSDVATGETATNGKGGGGSSSGGTSVAAGGTGTSSGSAALPPAQAGLECAAGKNGGATDKGITDSEIKMATTVVESGIGAAFLGDVRFAMEAVRNRINRDGGICGRQLSIEYRDDGWDAQRGAQYLRNFIQSGIFGIPVGPSSEGLRIVIESGDIDRNQVPVIGTDGMLISQYQTTDGKAQPWVWPIAAATVSSARAMVQEAYKRGARNFSIVFDKNYRFGVEAAEAFNDEVKRLTGKDVTGYNSQYNCQDSFCGIVAGQSSYSGDVATFKEGDFVGLFLEPATARVWMSDPNTYAASDSRIKYGYGAGQPLFTRGFAVNCQSKCDQMMVWTGFKPPIEGYANDPSVRAYVEDLKRTKPDADEYNAFAEGGYIGMLLLEDALKRVGPDLTRARLQAALNSTCIATGLTIQAKVCYNPSTRFANTTMQSFVIQYKGTFGGWRSGPIIKDTGA